MAIVFVHGVATRRGTEYEEGVRARDALLREYVYDHLRLDRGMPVTSAYWGDDAAEFRWDHASVPTEGVEAFGPATPLEDVVLAEFVDAELDRDDRALVPVAAADPEAAFDLLWAASVVDADDATVEALAALAPRASRVLAGLDRSVTAEATYDDELLEKLVGILQGDLERDPDERVESFGGEGILDRLSEGLIRVRGAAGRLIGRGATKLLRSKVHENGALFLGDVMTYLNERGDTRERAGPIVTKVMGDIDQAVAEAPGTPLVIIAHSMGGIIAYDVLSHFRPDLECQLLLTVGSQVGLFEELCLLARGKQQGCPDLAKVPALANVQRWINVFDYNDVLGFSAKKIFDGVDDFAYSTGKGVVKAHSSYFLFPSFYRRLAARIGA
jgi:hypothetical protein